MPHYQTYQRGLERVISWAASRDPPPDNRRGRRTIERSDAHAPDQSRPCLLFKCHADCDPALCLARNSEIRYAGIEPATRWQSLFGRHKIKA